MLRVLTLLIFAASGAALAQEHEREAFVLRLPPPVRLTPRTDIPQPFPQSPTHGVQPIGNVL